MLVVRDVKLFSDALLGVIADHIRIADIVSFDCYEKKIFFGPNCYSFNYVIDHIYSV